MNYEDFSPEAHKTIDQWLDLASKIKNEKILVKITHKTTFSNHNKYDFKPNYFCDPIHAQFRDFVFGMCFANNCLNERYEINQFLSGKNYFFPALENSTLEEYFEAIKQYPFIAQ